MLGATLGGQILPGWVLLKGKGKPGEYYFNMLDETIHPETQQGHHF